MEGTSFCLILLILQEFMDVSSVDYETELLPKTEKYYRKTIELAQENNIPIIVVVAPYGLSEYDKANIIRPKKLQMSMA